MARLRCDEQVETAEREQRASEPPEPRARQLAIDRRDLADIGDDRRQVIVPEERVDLARHHEQRRPVAPHAVADGANPVLELPNELNGRVSGATYAAMACNAYRKVKAVDPSFKVIGASENVYASGWATWLEEVYKGGYVNCSDGISWHNYDPPSDQSKWNTLRNLHTKYGALGEDVWLTEFGATTCPNVTGSSLGCQTEQGQANRITAVLKDLAANKRYVTHALGYVDENVPSRQSTDPFEANFGIYKNDGKGNITGAKAAVAAIKALYRP